MSSSGPPADSFDFEAHRRAAVDRYQPLRPLYEAFSGCIRLILDQALAADGLKVASLEARAKSLDSFGRKAKTPSDTDPGIPKYANPLGEITDLAGARIITFFPRDVAVVDASIQREMEILERVDKADILFREDRLGYQSVHYIVRLRRNRAALPEYARYADLKAEVQVRTILQHAWAEIEHDIQYRSVETIPLPIRRRFLSLAGLLELADREFQAVQEEDERLRREARRSVAAGQLGSVEITPDALKSYLDRKLEPDGRMSEYSYQFTARLLRQLGFRNFQQIDDAIAGYDDDRLSRVVWGARQGQLSRFETMVMAAMGEEFIKRHPFRKYADWPSRQRHHLETLTAAQIPIKNLVPGEAGDHLD
jgi:ppGpp synthetase/RelA/SpoT-type nucleotidyltranferase